MEEWKLEFAFPNQSHDFAYGFEAGTFYVRLRLPGLHEIREVVMEKNLDIFKAMAIKYNFDFEYERTEVPGWIEIHLTRKDRLLSLVK